MATEIYLRKLHHHFVPIDSGQLELMEELAPNGEYKAVLTQPRNVKFFRKWWALAKVAFDAWDAPYVEYKGVSIQKNFDRFRKDLIVMTGYFDPVFNVKGELRMEPRSMRFDKMSEEDFSQLYSKTIDVILGKILSGYTKDDLDNLVDKVLSFS
jgi:hypothetical protein